MQLAERFKNGEITEFGKPDSTIETLLSDLFFFGDRVVKIYKHKEAFYGNLADPAFRKEFYTEDFFWNNAMSPDIYLKLVEVEGDYYIEMRRIDTSKNLTNLLVTGQVSVSEIKKLTREKVTKLRSLTAERKEKLQHYFDLGWHKLSNDDLEDLREWMFMADTYIPRALTNEYVDLLVKASGQDDNFINHNPEHLSVAIDGNCDNLLILDGEPAFIDIMTPKDNWKVSDEFFNIARIATDVEVLGGLELKKAVYEEYRNFREIPSQMTQLVNELRSAMIQWPYRYILGQPELAEKYAAFVHVKCKELRSMIN